MTIEKDFLIFLILSLTCNQGQCFIGNNIFKTRNPDLFEHFCVETEDGLEEIGQKTSTHESITIQGTIHKLRNQNIRIFGPPPPLSNHVFNTTNN
jgi:hypothetical protein